MDIKQSVAVLKSLADETRLSIVRHLSQVDGAINSQDIVLDCSVALKLSQPTMSHHFSRLVAAGVLVEDKRGVEKYYTLDRELLAQAGFDPSKL